MSRNQTQNCTRCKKPIEEAGTEFHLGKISVWLCESCTTEAQDIWLNFDQNYFAETPPPEDLIEWLGLSKSQVGI